MPKEKYEGFEPFDLFPTVRHITRVGKSVVRFLTPGVHLLATHGDNFVHDPTPDPEDTLASDPTLFQPDWVGRGRSVIDERPPSLNRWDDCGADMPEDAA